VLKTRRQNGRNADVDYYTCTMHPSVHSKDPGKCPICSMDLVPVIKKVSNETKATENSSGTTGNSSMGSMPMSSPNQEAGKSSEFTVPGRTTTADWRNICHGNKATNFQLSIRSVGMLEADTSKMFDYVARVDGYVQELKVSSPGRMSRKVSP